MPFPPGYEHLGTRRKGRTTTTGTGEAYSLTAAIRSKLRDPELAGVPGDGTTEARISDTIPGAPIRPGALKLPYVRPQAGVVVGDFTTGGALANPAPSTAAEIARPDTVLRQLGAREVELGTGYSGKQTVTPSRASWGWLDPELGETHQTEITFGARSFSPQEMGAAATITRRMLKSTNAEAIVREAFRVAVAEAVEVSALQGTGRQGQPQGVIEDPAVTAQTAAGATPTWPELLGAAQAAIDNGAPLSQLGWCLPDEDYAALLAVERTGGKPAIREHDDGSYSLGGRPVRFSPHLPGGKYVVGAWRQFALVFAGGPQLLVNPFSRSNYAETEISVFQMMDCGAIRPQFFTVLSAA